MSNNFPDDINTYKDFCNVIKGKTAKDMQYMYDTLYFTNHIGSKDIGASYFNSDGLHKLAWIKKIIDTVTFNKEDVVLDIGCGRGELVFQLAHIFKLRAIGIDYSRECVNFLNDIKRKHPIEVQENIGFYCVNAEKIELEDNCIDKIFIVETIEHISNKEFINILKECKRLLKPNGLLYIASKSNKWFDSSGFYILKLLYYLFKRERLLHPKVGQFKYLKQDKDYDESKIFLHINEQSVLSLKYILMKAGFKSTISMDNTNNLFNCATLKKNKFLAFLYDLFRLKYLFGDGFTVFAYKK